MTKTERREYVRDQLAASGVRSERTAGGRWMLMKADRRMVVDDIADLQKADIAQFAGERPNHTGYVPGDCLW